MYNKAILIGRMTADPELKQTQSGIYVVAFSIAVDRKYTSGGERKADFLNITAWRNSAEFVCKYFHKGEPIGIEGSIQTRNYEDKNGNKRTVTEIVADNVFFVGGKSTGQCGTSAVNEQNVVSGANSTSVAGVGGFEEIEADDDLPF